MGIMDLFRPKWKNSDPEIRLKAVQKMTPDESEQLRQIAGQDPDTKVRVEAIGKIVEKSFLQDAAFSAEDSQVMLAAKDRLNAINRENIFKATDFETRKTILEDIDDLNILTQVACDIDDPEIRLIAVDKIQDPERLCQIAESNCGLKAGQAIIQHLSDPKYLERIASYASNKKIRKQSQEKLEAIVGKPPEPEKTPLPLETPSEETALEDLCCRLEKLSVFEEPQTAQTLLSDAQKMWNNISVDDHHLLWERFKTLRTHIEAELEQMEKQTRAIETAKRLCLEAEALKADITPETDLKLKTLKDQWAKMSEMPLPDDQNFDYEFNQTVEKIEKIRQDQIKQESRQQEIFDMLTAYCEEAEGLSQTDAWQEACDKLIILRKKWEKTFIDAPKDAPKFRQLLGRFAMASENFERRKDVLEEKQKQLMAEQEKQLFDLCETVEKISQSQIRSGLDKKIKSIQQEWKNSGGLIFEKKAELTPRFKEACDQFFARQREYWENLEWERWANLNQKKELCDLVEKLAELEETREVAKIVREAQKKWKKIGPVSRDKSEKIWTRFTKACDQVFHRCLAEKTILYNEVQMILTPQINTPLKEVPESFNWTETSEKVKAIQSQWAAVGSLPLSLEKELRDNFYTLCNSFFNNLRAFYQQRDLDREENLAQKKALCEQAEALICSEDWNTTSARLKKLQQEWKNIGPVPKNESDQIWARFRGTCDTFFNQIKFQQPENLLKKQALCEQVEALTANITEDTDLVKMGRELIEMQKKWKAIGPVPADQSDIIWQRFRKPCDEFFDQRKAYFEERKSKESKNQILKQALIDQAEDLAHSTDWKNTADTLKKIQKEWKTIGPAPRKIEQELWEQFRGACDTFFNRRKDFFDEMQKNRKDNLKQKERLCVSLEAMAFLVLPEEAAKTLEGVQTAEHLSMGLKYKNEILVPANHKETWEKTLQKVKEIQKTWKTIGPVPHEKDDEVWKRYRRAVDVFFINKSKNINK